jgi:hypothetical protein
MLIEFRIQMDDNGGVNVVQAPANANPNSPGQQRLPVAYAAPGPAAPNPAANKGGSGPIDGLGMGAPTGAESSASGMVFVLGPIVICGSGGAGPAGPGGSGPIDGLGMGEPDGNGDAAAPNNKDAAAKKRRQPGKQY